jgi:hypothetical protein
MLRIRRGLNRELQITEKALLLSLEVIHIDVMKAKQKLAQTCNSVFGIVVKQPVENRNK